MPVVLKKSINDGLYKRSRELDYAQRIERVAVMMNAVSQLESQGETRESAMETLLMVGFLSEGILDQEQTRRIYWSTNRGLRGYDLARNHGLSNFTENGAGEFSFPIRPTTRTEAQPAGKAPSKIWAL